MSEVAHLLWAVVAMTAIISGSILAHHKSQTPEERAFNRCTVSGSALVESAARIACAKVIFDKEETQ